MTTKETKYVLKDEKGVVKAKLSGEQARALVLDADGQWRPYPEGPRWNSRVFQIDGEHVYEFDELELYVWPGDLIFEPDK
jgi:hypothetical protein